MSHTRREKEQIELNYAAQRLGARAGHWHPTPFACPACPQAFSRKLPLQRHIHDVHLHDVLFLPAAAAEQPIWADEPPPARLLGPALVEEPASPNPLRVGNTLASEDLKRIFGAMNYALQMLRVGIVQLYAVPGGVDDRWQLALPLTDDGEPQGIDLDQLDAAGLGVVQNVQ